MSDRAGESSADQDLQTVIDRMADGFFALDADWRVTYANEEGRRILRAAMRDDAVDPSETVVGCHLWDSIPNSTGTEFYERYHHAMDVQESVSFDSYYEPLGVWFDVRVFPSDEGLSVYLRDITERRDLERRQRESLRAIQRLYAVSSDQDRTFEEKVEAILTLGCEYLDVPNGFLTRIEDGTQHVEISHAEHPLLQAGETCPLDEAYCKRTIERDRLLTVVDASENGWNDDSAYETFGLETYIGGQVEIDGEQYGTLCFAATTPRGEPFTDTQRTFVELLTRWVSYELERQHAAEQLERERDRLDEFASVVSHDLRNPLTAARGRLDLLAEESDSDHIAPIERSLSRMETLIDDLLALAREGSDVEDPDPVDLAALATDAWKTSDSRGGTLRVALDDSEVLADEARLRQLFENLFRNAVEHGGEDVTVTVGPLADGAGFYVADDGEGIPEAERDQVFETGYTTTTDGTGFGLNIVAEIADAHGWAVRVTASEADGARFEITGVEAA
ncbi:GAF sensor signal transduction histidine kinase [Halorubrum ezzemoulense]|jgi:signal transduction histidine kinase|uniref:histidine kinase n=1 Tax=Halorubrum ezzemoulense TaxID=337243 RepID=A0A238UVI7_HALEZ|nr:MULTISPECIES: ATP-binding protein [Halorubrum]MDB2225409.1 ATP-binding protein [Halorubrum ezzemoulense]MDB9232536.1 ATP-binding protein [Halorubrum ezzemoulense]OTF10565.1 histidine kinase [Halorubrum sp. SD612]OYR77116.1 histidine kinase [Halorubrum ezzemoulense]OYR83316.1 histidine kinase [Halorubrum ezzemoulense]